MITLSKRLKGDQGKGNGDAEKEPQSSNAPESTPKSSGTSASGGRAAIRDKHLLQGSLDFAVILRDVNWPEEYVEVWSHIKLFARVGRDTF